MHLVHFLQNSYLTKHTKVYPFCKPHKMKQKHSFYAFKLDTSLKVIYILSEIHIRIREKFHS